MLPFPKAMPPFTLPTYLAFISSRPSIVTLTSPVHIYSLLYVFHARSTSLRYLLFCRSSHRHFVTQALDSHAFRHLRDLTFLIPLPDTLFRLDLNVGLVTLLFAFVCRSSSILAPTPYLLPSLLHLYPGRNLLFFGDGFLLPLLTSPLWSVTRRSPSTYISLLLLSKYQHLHCWCSPYQKPVTQLSALAPDRSRLDSLLSFFDRILEASQPCSSITHVQPFSVAILSSISENGRRMPIHNEIALYRAFFANKLASNTNSRICLFYHPRHTSHFKAQLVSSLSNLGILVVDPTYLLSSCLPAELKALSLSCHYSSLINSIYVFQTSALLLAIHPQTQSKLSFGFGSSLLSQFIPRSELEKRSHYEAAMSSLLSSFALSA